MSVQIIVDSTVDMPERMKDRFRIVPLTVHFGAEEFIDGVTIDNKTFVLSFFHLFSRIKRTLLIIIMTDNLIFRRRFS